MNKTKLFLENFIVYGLGGVISKIIPLIMVPIVAKIMPTTEYFGISDMSNTIISFASALAIMGMYDAMYRLFFEKDDDNYKKEVCSTTLFFTIIASTVVFILMLLLKTQLARWFFKDKGLFYVVYISAMATLVSATNGIISAPTRMQNKKKIFLVTNTVSPIISYGISIPLLLKGYYIIALPLAGAISGLSMEIVFAVLNRKWFSIKNVKKEHLKPLLFIALPLVPNFLIYWIFNSSDRLMITNLLSLGDDGIYAVGAKLGMASQLIYTAFAGGWQYFAFATMKEKDQVKTNSCIFEYLGAISFAGTTVVCAISYFIYDLLFDGDYVKGFIVAPYLFLAPLLQMLFQVGANQFLVIKKTWPNLFIMLSGAVCNIGLNFILIPRIGIEGAAIATLLGYCITDVICTIVLIKIKLMVLSPRFIVCLVIFGGYFVFWRLFCSDRTVLSMLGAFVMCIVFVLFYSKEIKLIIAKIKK